MQLIVEGIFILEKFTNKGGWTYIKFMGEMIPGSRTVGKMKISSSIDAYNFKDKHLMPMRGAMYFCQYPNQ